MCARPDCARVFYVRSPSRRGKYCSLACAGRTRTEAAAAKPDPYEIAWLAARQDQRVDRWLPLLAAGAHSIRCRDAHGVQVLWERAVRADDMAALFTACLARIAQLEDALNGERTTEVSAA